MERLERDLEFYGVSRRDFLKYCASFAVLFGLSELEFTRRLAHAVEKAERKPPVIWLEGQDCAGCTVSFAGLLYPPVGAIILDKLSLRYHETLMASAGELAESVYHETVKEGGYVLVVEGSIPSSDDRFCLVGGRPFREIVLEASKNATCILAVGACASFGGIPKATVSKGMGVKDLVSGKPIINLPTCPVHPDHLVGTILYILTTGKLPELDDFNRPKMYYSQSIHDNCRRRGHFEAGNFLQDWNDPAQKDYCLFEKGCKGPMTYADCPIRRWNSGTNFCIDCGAPCVGCAEPGFYDEMSPIYTAESEASRKILALKKSGLI
ncbi:MAG: Ni,Fe-hydrogenase small subunit [Deltaproteobacteria bacterium]|nr:MAG: Ni,Fe-hydrogenase small subunit [Deltaproteobacteria bacterium]